MTRNLRKRHLQAWLVLAVLLPAGIISPWLVKPGKAVESSVATQEKGIFPIETNGEKAFILYDFIQKKIVDTIKF